MKKTKYKPIQNDPDAKLSEYWRERTVFPSSVPLEVKILIEKSSNIDKSFFRKMIKLALGYIQETLSPENCTAAFENLTTLKGCQKEADVLELCKMYSGVITLLNAVLKINMKTVREPMLMQDLQELGLPESFSADICKIVFGSAHPDIMDQVLAHNPHLKRMEDFSWKINQSDSSSQSKEPSISMEIKTDDGETHAFDVPFASFHNLRHTTALLLRQMELSDRRK